MTRLATYLPIPAPTLLALTLALGLSACANLAPSYQQPAAPVPNHWSSTAAGSDNNPTATAPAAAAAISTAATSTAVESLDWRGFFLDQRLRQVIAQALANNRDLRVAALNVQNARAQYRITDANRYPALSASASSSASRTPASLASSGTAVTSHDDSVSLGVSAFEWDFFGRLKNLSDAALQTYQYQVETRRSTQISLVAEVATAWLTLASDRELLKLSQDTFDSLNKTYTLSVRSHEIGTSSAIDLASQEASLQSARADVGQYTSQVAQDLNALTLLVGASVDQALLPEQLPEAAGVLLETPAGLPSATLLRRPDVLAAEHTLKAAHADIGAARAAFFPSITRTASNALGGLFKPGSGAWSFAPAINLPIFNAGSNRASLDAAKITRDIDVANYEKAIQTAFEEVSNALAVRATLQQRLDAQQQVTAADARSYRLSEARYRNGIDSYLTALVTQRALYSAQQNLISLRLTEQNNRITLYKVLGGGWQE